MISINKMGLMVINQYIDTNNPKYELNYMYVDEENAVSTNTRAMGVVEHQGSLKEEPFFIAKDIVTTALKVRGGESYGLSKDSIIVYDKMGIEMMTIVGKDTKLRAFVDYKQVLITEYKDKIAFANIEQAQGITAIKKVHLNNKLVPKIKDTWEGYLLFNSTDLPIGLIGRDKIISVVIMPIIDELSIFRS